jgi:hypothetical protein
MSLIIGLHGAKGSGKDQFFKAVKAAYPQMKVRKIAYADPIKEQVVKIFDLKDEDEYDEFKRTQLQWTLRSGQNMPDTVSGRHAVREIGMLMRSYNQDQFVQYVEDTILADPEGIWCITDLRFNNELHSIKCNLGGLVIKIKRDGVQFDGHVTETEFPDEICTSVIQNVGLTLEQYNERVVEEMKKIMQTIALVKEKQ